MKKLLLLITVTTLGFSAVPYHKYIDDMETGFKKYKVISSTPITKEVTKRVRIGDEIRDRVVNKRVPCGNGYKSTNSIGFDTLIGTVAGIAIGNQFHHHKDAAKVIGGIGGGYIANQIRNRDKAECYEQSTVQEYIPRYDTVTEYVTVGYNNCAFVDGEKICKESKNKRNFLKVKKTYSIY
jgi:uncharacterized protein YcfJ